MAQPPWKVASLLGSKDLFRTSIFVEDFPFSVQHVEGDGAVVHREEGDAGVVAAELRPFDGLHFPGQRTGGVDDVIHRAAGRLDVLEVVDMPAEVHVYLIFIEQRLDVAAHVGFSGAILNPFTIGIAQGLSGLPLFSGFGYRIFCWALLTFLLIVFVLRYATKVKKNPESSLMYQQDRHWREKSGKGIEIDLRGKTTRSAWIVYILLLVALACFSVNYPMAVFEVGEKAFRFAAVPALVLVFGFQPFSDLEQTAEVLVLHLSFFVVLLRYLQAVSFWVQVLRFAVYFEQAF